MTEKSKRLIEEYRRLQKEEEKEKQKEEKEKEKDRGRKKGEAQAQEREKEKEHNDDTELGEITDREDSVEIVSIIETMIAEKNASVMVQSGDEKSSTVEFLSF